MNLSHPLLPHTLIYIYRERERATTHRLISRAKTYTDDDDDDKNIPTCIYTYISFSKSKSISVESHSVYVFLAYLRGVQFRVNMCGCGLMWIICVCYKLYTDKFDFRIYILQYVEHVDEYRYGDWFRRAVFQ